MRNRNSKKSKIPLTDKEISHVQSIVKTFGSLTRNQLAGTICEHLNWFTATGRCRLSYALSILEKMENQGLLKLPEKKVYKERKKHKIRLTPKTESKPELTAEIASLGEIIVRPVFSTEDQKLWNEYVERYHYLGYKRPFGNHIRYFIETKNKEILGCFLFCSSAWAISERDQWIEWSEEDRKRRLNLVLNNGRFLIFPWVKVRNLASTSLAILSKRIREDWYHRYNLKPVLLETFVDSEKYNGGCYKASNWKNLGLTKGRGRSDTENEHALSKKHIFVYPLTEDFKKVLNGSVKRRSPKPKISKSAIKPDEDFINLWQKISVILSKTANEYDEKWRIRKRVIDTYLLVLLIFRVVFSKGNQGYDTTIAELWDEFRKVGIKLPQENPIAASSFTNARKKLDENIFKDLNRNIVDTCDDLNQESFKWHGMRIFAMDGTKINLPLNLKRYGYKLPNSQSWYPQGVLSTLYQLKANIPYDFDLVKFRDERKCALQHMKQLKEKDLVVYDRGYYSYGMLYFHHKFGIHAVFRLQDSSSKAIEDFRKNTKLKDSVVTIIPGLTTAREFQAQNPDEKILGLDIRCIKYQIEGKEILIGTTLLEKNRFPLKDFPDLYHSRWGIEEMYKVSKTFIDIQEFHAKHERGVKQELYASFVLMTLTRFISNKVEADLNMQFKHQKSGLKKTEQNSQIKVNFKNSLQAVFRRCAELFSKTRNYFSSALDEILKSTQRVRSHTRPGRKFPRRSKKPYKKWIPTPAPSK